MNNNSFEEFVNTIRNEREGDDDEVGVPSSETEDNNDSISAHLNDQNNLNIVNNDIDQSAENISDESKNEMEVNKEVAVCL